MTSWVSKLIVTLSLVGELVGFAQCKDQWVQQFSALPSGVLSNGSPSMVVDQQGNILVTNVVASADTILAGGQAFPETNSFPPNSDVFIAKYSSLGSLVWFKTILGNGDCSSFDIEVDDSANVYVCGLMQNSIEVDGLIIERPLAPQPGFFILKFNSEGDLQWFHKGDYRGSRCYRISWTGASLAFAIPYSDSLNLDGQIFYSEGGQDMVMGSISSNGTFLSSFNVGGTGTLEANSLSCGTTTCIVQGRFDQELSLDGTTLNTGDFGRFGIYQIEVSLNGSLLWANSSVSPSNIDPRVYGLDLLNDSVAAFAGHYFNAAFQLDGFTMPPPVETDVFIGSVNRSTGSVTWLENVTGDSFEGVTSLVSTDFGFITAGTFHSQSISYNGNGLTNSIDGQNDGMSLLLDTNGNWVCGQVYEGFGQNGVLQIDRFDDGRLAILLYFNGTVVFEGNTYTSIGGYDLLLIRACPLCDTLTSIGKFGSMKKLTVHPNPSSTAATLTLPNAGTYGINPSTPLRLTVMDAMGRVVHRSDLTTQTSQLNTSNWPQGIYAVTATDQKGVRYACRLVVGN